MSSDQHLTLRAAPVQREQREQRRRVSVGWPRDATDQPGDGGGSVGKRRATTAKVEISDKSCRLDAAASEKLINSAQERILAEEPVGVGGVEDAGDLSL